MFNNFGYGDEGLYTREDEIEYIEEPLAELIASRLGVEPSIRCYMDEWYYLDIDIEVNGYYFNIKTSRPVDGRKVRVASDLQKYVPDLFHKFYMQYLETVDEEDL